LFPRAGRRKEKRQGCKVELGKEIGCHFLSSVSFQNYLTESLSTVGGKYVWEFSMFKDQEAKVIFS